VKLKRLEEALDHFEKALEIRKKIHKEKHLSIADSLCETGFVLAKLGRIEEAAVRITKGIRMRLKIHGVSLKIEEVQNITPITAEMEIDGMRETVERMMSRTHNECLHFSGGCLLSGVQKSENSS
jgi:hypothetical protein